MWAVFAEFHLLDAPHYCVRSMSVIRTFSAKVSAAVAK